MRYLNWSEDEIKAFNRHIAEQDRQINIKRYWAIAQHVEMR